MKVFHVVPDISLEANGVTPFLNGLSGFAVECGDHVSICSLAAKNLDPRVEFLRAKRPSLFNLNEYSPDFSRYIKSGFLNYDVVHCHSLWSAANLSVGIHANQRRARLVVSPHGTLAGYALSRRKIIKKILWPIQKLAFSRADLVHATAESEVVDIRCAGYQGPVALIPNGIEIPQICQNIYDGKKKQLLFLGRIHPIKGLENLLQAWALISKKNPEWELVIAGGGAPDYEKSLKDLSKALHLERVKWVGPVYGLDKAKLYQESAIFVLPSHSENFGMVIAEALSYGLPCVASKGTPWAILEDEKIGWWVDNNAESIASALGSAMSISFKELLQMGWLGRIYVEQNYAWPHIGRMFHDTFNWLIGNAQRPTFVIN